MIWRRLVGPNARKTPRLDGELPPPMTHEQVDKLLRPQRKSPPSLRQRREEWIIKTRFPIGDSIWSRGGGVAYWGSKRHGGAGLTPYRANATRYESENAALYEAYSYKEAGRIDDFEVEKLPPKVSLKGSSGTGGRA